MIALSTPFLPRPAGARSRGFTLIELMVVLIIIGIASSMLAVRAFPDRQQGLRQEAQRLAELFKTAQVEARADGRRIEWQHDVQGYRFVRLQRNTAPTPYGVRPSMPLPDFFEQDALLHPRRWQAGPVRVQGDAIAFTAEWLLPPARIELHDDESHLTLLRTAAGDYEIH